MPIIYFGRWFGGSLFVAWTVHQSIIGTGGVYRHTRYICNIICWILLPSVVVVSTYLVVGDNLPGIFVCIIVVGDNLPGIFVCIQGLIPMIGRTSVYVVVLCLLHELSIQGFMPRNIPMRDAYSNSFHKLGSE